MPRTTYSSPGTTNDTLGAEVSQLYAETIGAQGGDATVGTTGSGGLGGLASGILGVNGGESLQINVGAAGADSSGGNTADGGEASDVRVAGTALSDRVFVGGGGGGAADGNRTQSGVNGGDGGADIGESGDNSGDPVGSSGQDIPGGPGGTQNAGGENPFGGAGDGTFGFGGNGDTADGVPGAGNGGDGWYGGAGGGQSTDDSFSEDYASAGGGGSNRTAPAATNTTSTRGVQSGDGQVLVEYYADPTGLTATPGSDGTSEVDLSWTDNATGGNYAVEISTDGGSTWSVETNSLPASTNSYTVTGLDSGTPYRFRVRVVGTDINSFYSNEEPVTTHLAPDPLEIQFAGQVPIFGNRIVPDPLEIQFAGQTPTLETDTTSLSPVPLTIQFAGQTPVTSINAWLLDQQILSVTQEEVATHQELRLQFRLPTDNLNEAARPAKANEGQVDVLPNDDGGFVAIDRANGGNTFDVSPPSGRAPLREPGEFHVQRYEESLVSQSVDEWDVTLELIRTEDREDRPDTSTLGGLVFDWTFTESFQSASTPEITGGPGEWVLFMRYGALVTDRVDAEFVGTGADGVERYELTMRLPFMDAYVLESTLSLLEGTRVKEIPDAPNRIIDETATDANTISITSPTPTTVASDEYVALAYESRRLNDAMQEINLEIALKAE